MRRSPKLRLESGLNTVRSTRGRFRKWAAAVPLNYAHRSRLLEAEWLRVRGRPFGDVVRCYTKAIELAAEQRYLHDEALAHELCGRST